MKYKVLKATELYKKLSAISRKAKEVRKAAHDLALSVGAKGGATTGSRYAAGGIDAFDFAYGKEPPKELWMQPDRHNNRQLFYPQYGKKYKENDWLHDKIKALPVVTFEELNSIISFEHYIGPSSTPGVLLVDVKRYALEVTRNYALISIAEECKHYNPLKDMIEITVSEFHKLSKEK